MIEPYVMTLDNNKAVYQDTPIWRGYQHLKLHFAGLSTEKETFFRLLAQQLPLEEPEIQSSDGLFIDILWTNISVSITETDSLSFSADELALFAYFEKCSDSIPFIRDALRKNER